MVRTSVPAEAGQRATWGAAADALGPRLAELACALSEQGVAALLLVPGSQPGETDLFCDRVAHWLEHGLCVAGQAPIAVHLVEWAGEAHDLGCADGAVRLLDALLALQPHPGKRILLLGVGQAAHVLALACWLIAANSEAAAQVFQAASVYYRWPLLRCVDIPLWERVRRALERPPALADSLLDLVLWGPGARYPWRLDNRMRLLHFVPPTAADWAERPRPPDRVAWRARLADRQLRRLFESGGLMSPFSDLSPARPATVCQSEITTVHQAELAPPAPGIQDRTLPRRQQWTLALAEEVVRQFYPTRQLRVA